MNPAFRDLTDQERLDWLRLIRSENIGPRSFQGLLERYGSAGAALDALPGLLRRSRSAREVKVCPVRDAEQEMDRARRLGVRFIAQCEAAYPAALRAIDAPPPLIAASGVIETLLRPSVAIVGSRNASASGLIFTERLAKGLGGSGYVVVSGLARGIDGKAHQSSLESGTVAVLAGGHERIYPSEHEALARRILASGALISEMPLAWEPRARDFPRRNRIVSGLSLGVVVVEANRRSGSLITARFANEQGREVFAVPGSPLDARAEGTNDLLRQGATMCTSAEDVLTALAPAVDGRAGRPSLAEPRTHEPTTEPLWDELDLFADPDAPPVRSSSSEAARPRATATLAETDVTDPGAGSDLDRLVGLIGPVPMQVDELIRASALAPRDLQAALMELEIAGQIRRHDGNRVSLNFEARDEAAGSSTKL